MQQDQNNPLEESINDIKNLQDAVKTYAENSDDVKSGKCTKEDELNEPGYILYQHIAESTINILQNPEIVNAFKNISGELSEEVSKNLVTIMAVSMTQAAHHAVLFYDDLLKQELTKQFDEIAKYLNNTKADVEGSKSAISLLRKKISDIENAIKINNFNKKNGNN